MENQTPTQRPSFKKPFIAIITVLVLGAGAILAFASGLFKGGDSDQDILPEQNPATQDTGNSSQLDGTNPNMNGNDQNMMGPDTSMMNSGSYKDGTYTVNQTYRSPGGDEKFTLILTIKNDVITDSSFTPAPVSKIGIFMQDSFNSAYKSFVIGKNIDDISLDVVNGASLTTGGFIKALEAIRIQAQA